LNRIGYILTQMKPIRNLNGLGSSLRCRSRVVTSPISATMCDLGMAPYPSGNHLDVSFGQQVNDVMPLHIYQNGSKGSTTTKGKVVKPKHRDLACWHRWRAHNPTQDAEVRRLYPQTQTQPHTGSSTARQAKRLDQLTQSARRASPRLKKGRKPLSKDPASALAVATEEFAHMQDQLYPTASTSQISSRSRVAAMDTRAFLQAARTCCLRQH
jgi:hypothetical protein